MYQSFSLGDEGDVWSVTDRRPGNKRLEGLFLAKATAWWIAVRVGVHWALVLYWL